MRIKIVGAGLIGTSLALALKAQGDSIQFQDSDQSAARLAQELIGQARALEAKPEAKNYRSLPKDLSPSIPWRGEKFQGLSPLALTYLKVELYS